MIEQIEFFTPARISEMWEMLEMLMRMVSPGVMISFAITAVGLVLVIIINAFKQAAAKKDDDDEIEVRHY